MAELDRIERKLDRLLERQTRGGRFLPVARAAEYAGVSIESIRRLLATGRLTPYRPLPGRVVVDQRQLDEMILASTCGPHERPQSGAP